MIGSSSDGPLPTWSIEVDTVTSPVCSVVILKVQVPSFKSLFVKRLSNKSMCGPGLNLESEYIGYEQRDVHVSQKAMESESFDISRFSYAGSRHCHENFDRVRKVP
jgi:hypothetical protein